MTDDKGLIFRFSKKRIQDRQTDILVGLSKGIIADGTVNQREAEFLQRWVSENSDSEHPMVMNLMEKLYDYLEDGFLDQEEAQDLLTTLRGIAGEQGELGEVSKTSSLPVCNPAPQVIFEERIFLFTGTCAFGTRAKCQEVVEGLGGINAKSVTKKLNYLVLGTYVDKNWVHESFGRKIEKAMEYRDLQNLPISIISEEHWANEAGI